MSRTSVSVNGKHPSFSLSVVIATRNPPPGLGELLFQMDEFLTHWGVEHELLLVDDASTVSLNNYPFLSRVRLIQLPKQHGQHRALLAGFRLAKMEWIYTQDDDVLPRPEQLKRWIMEAVTCDIPLSYGSYTSSPVTHRRYWLGQLVRGAYALFANQWKQPTSLRLFQRKLVADIPSEQIPFFLESWLLASAEHVRFTPITVKKMSGVTSRYRLVDLVQLALKVLFLYTSLPFWIFSMSITAVLLWVNPLWALYSTPLLILLNILLIRIWGCPMGVWARRRIWGKSV